MLTESNYWLTTIQQKKLPNLPLPSRADVVVIGGGFSGLSASLTLAKAGVTVVVLEAETIGWGASSRNGGMVLTGIKQSVETLIRNYGRARAVQMFNLSLASIKTVEQIVKEENIDCAFSRCGHLEMAWKPAHFNSLSRTAELLDKEFGHRVSMITRAEQRSEIGSDRYYGGLLDELSARINPAQFVMGLARAAANAGASLHENARVLNVTARASKFYINTNRGDILADQVFVGTGGYTGRAIPSLQKRIFPIGSYIIATEPLTEKLAEDINPRNRMIFDSKNFLFYFRLTPDQRLLFGGRAVFKPETEKSIRESAPYLRLALIDIFPQLEATSIDYLWGGSLDFALDSMPHIGQIDGIYHALGYAGHGVAFATHFGKLVASLLIGRPMENPLSGLPFRPFPLYNGTPWYLPLAGWYYRLLDFLY